jgi:hypothetical protein
MLQSQRRCGIKLFKVRAHLPRFESDGKSSPVKPVLIKIEKHEPGRKKPIKKKAPAFHGDSHSCRHAPSQISLTKENRSWERPIARNLTLR